MQVKSELSYILFCYFVVFIHHDIYLIFSRSILHFRVEQSKQTRPAPSTFPYSSTTTTRTVFINSTMHLRSLLLSGFASLATAQINYCAGDKSTVGHCETLTYIDRTTTASGPPSTAECQDACRGVLTDAGDWIVDFRGMIHTLPLPCSSPPFPPIRIWSALMLVLTTLVQENQTATARTWSVTHAASVWAARQGNPRTTTSTCITRTLWIFWTR